MKKTFEAKTEEEAVDLACLDLGITLEELHYKVIEEKKGLFSKKTVIECFDNQMVEEYMSAYIRRILEDMGFTVETATFFQDQRYYCNIDTDNNSILIGKGGVILRTLNFVTKHAVQTEFGERLEISVDINGYKEERFKKVAALGKRLGKQVQRTHVDVKLDPMPADERKVLHSTIAQMDHLRTESQGEGKDRFITIYYVED
ncbi:protein jag [Sharpea azabuensis]|jgi:spoIIIJ-associated protein|uniref:SpoIIIJ-associated protein n=1 Tax=Sharpea azabuensis TaxID=322505 RepID=A0A1H6U9D2_9FIRM|nr:R3H domain-containing nucleic acid-binding protein [Sharpea azabuensis]HAV19232.1 protein jag [Erysipelotrichaceae bacterium]MDD6513784.1 Jag N-terminal domain-containing protein [Sharpea azabuensis]MEE3308356.1 R3H domain-containing nucleic acid-binding protein [Sharpea azabuensis]SEI84845.1 spoIIIJ-associated protein [Sharpea azabuensis]SFD61933.1 spoIIIJ-associated protein [Sharpea azabuensis]